MATCSYYLVIIILMCSECGTGKCRCISGQGKCAGSSLTAGRKTVLLRGASKWQGAQPGTGVVVGAGGVVGPGVVVGPVVGCSMHVRQSFALRLAA